MRLYRFRMRRLRRFRAKFVLGGGKPRRTQLVVSMELKGKGHLKMWDGCFLITRRLRPRKAKIVGRFLLNWQWRWLIFSPALHNESLMLELLRAWEPLNSSGSLPNGARKETQSCFPHINSV